MAQPTARNHAHRGNHKPYAQMTLPNPQRHVVPVAVVTTSKLVPINIVRPVSTDVPKISVIRPRQATTVVTQTNSPPRRHINRHPSSKASNPQHALKDKGVIDSRCSRHMIGNMSYLSDFEELNGRYVAFGGNPKGGKISGKDKIRTGKLNFDDVYFVKELKFNLFSVTQMCDKKNSVLFTDTECLVLSPDFKLSDENQVLLRVLRKDNMYNVNLKNIVPSRDLTCLFEKATIDESNLWHRRLGHNNFKTMNKLVKGNLVTGLPTKVFENDNTCVACKKGKQHRASCKTKPVSSVKQPLYRLHMDLFGPTFVKSLNKKRYCLVVTDDYSRVLVTKPHNKTPYELLHGRTSSIGFMRPFGCPVTILNTLDSLGKFDGKVDEGFLVGYSVSGSAPTWLFDIDTLTNTMNYQPVTAGNQSNPSAGVQEQFDAENAGEESDQQYVLFPVWSFEFEDFSYNIINEVNAAGTLVPAVGQISPNSTNTFSAAGRSNTDASPTHGKSSCIDTSQLPDDPDMLELEDITYSDDEDDVGVEADFNNLETSIIVSHILTIRVHKDHHVTQIIGDLSSAIQTKSMTRVAKDQGGLSQINNDDFHTCMFACFLSQEEPRGYIKLLKIQVRLKLCRRSFFNSKCRRFGVLVDLSYGKRAIGTKWVFRNKNDERGIVVRNKARLDAQGHTQEEGINYEEVFAPVARIEAIRLFLAYASFMGFMVYQIDINSAFLYGTIEEEVYVCQPPGFKDPDHPDKVYKVVKALYGLHQAPRAWYETLANYLLENGFQRVKRIFRYLKGKPQLGLWYPKDSPFDLVAYSDSDYAGASLDRKSTTGGCQFLGCKLISWKCKKQTVVATSSTKVEYVDAASCRVQVLWIQNQLLDYRLELTELTVFLLPKVKKVGVEVSAVDLQVYAVRLILLVLVQKFLLFGMTNWCCSLSAVSSIKYALTMNPNIYVSCIKQFWTTVAVKKVNDVTRLQALVDKKVVVTEATIRDVLHLDDAEGVECLPNEEIFAELARMGYEKPSTKLTFYKAFFSSQMKFLIHTILQCMSANRTLWNEFSSSIASAVICLSSAREVAEGNANEVHGEDVNAAGVVTERVVSVADDIVPTADKEPFIPSPTPPTLPPQPSHDIPSTSQDKIAQALEITKLKQRVKKLERRNKVKVLKLRRLQKVGTAQRINTSDDTVMDDVSNQGRMITNMDANVDVVLEEAKDVAADIVKDVQDVDLEESAHDQERQAESQAEIYKIDLEHANKVLSILEEESEPAKGQEVVDVVTTAKIITEVVSAASETITAASITITTADAQVPAAITCNISYFQVIPNII
nr:putative ribonuclease H-like domain-containing protein [Tanacetum cinerariifolium]